MLFFLIIPLSQILYRKKGQAIFLKNNGARHLFSPYKKKVPGTFFIKSGAVVIKREWR